MVRAREFIHRDSMLPLAANQVLNVCLIERMQVYEVGQGQALMVFAKA